MESPAKKRSIFGFTGLWRSSTAPPSDGDATAKSTSMAHAAGSPMQSRVESGNASAPESPVKRASDAQLASRKILGRPQGPSSKLSQSFTAADFERPSPTIPNKSISFSESVGVGVAPRRRPGDNPYKTSSYSSATVSGTPTSQRTTNFSGTSSAPRNIFRSSAMYQRPGIPSFSPRVTPTITKQIFPPATPGRSSRGVSADVSGRGLANTTSSALFEMRISSPPRHLTGEMLTKELQTRPQDSSRSGSIYADEYLAHLCPPDLDEDQRRQFFCILDLRRLKYSADEVFTKKDWKINVLNFAKEYEKNRSLIMLRYGLYEFKTVRASEAVKKEWKQKHGIPDSDDESEPMTVSKPTSTGSKRKAEDDLKSSDTALTTSSNANKRARAPDVTATPSKNKRKANDEPDENQPSKLQKSSATPQKTPSATKSMFESIVNKGQGSSTPAKSPAKSLFASAPKLPNGTGGRSVFEATSKPSAAAANIFGHLSDASKGSPNDDADAESETDSAEGEGESEVQEASASEEPSSASGDAPTPQFASGKTPTTVNGTSTTSSEAGESSQGRSLFDRITRDADGQPVRKLPPQQGASPFAVSPDGERSASPAKDLATPAPAPAPAPANNTWNTGTPIKFTSGPSLFAPTTTKPTVDFGASAAAKKVAADAPTQPPAQNMFGSLKKPEEPVAKPGDAPKPASLFGQSTATPNLFGGLSSSASTGSNLFASGAPAFGQPKDKEGSNEAAAPKPAVGLFGAASTPAAPATGAGLFGQQAKTDGTAPASSTGLFGKTQSTDASAAAPSMFAQSTAPKTNLFGAASTTSTATEEPAAKKMFSGGDSKPGQSLFAFGGGASTTDAAKPAAESQPVFGAGNTTDAKPLFGAATTTESKPLFGAGITTEAKPLFGNGDKGLFGTTPAAGATQESKPMFGATTTTEAPKSLFGTAPTPAAEPSKPLFGGLPQVEAPKPGGFVFGSSAATPAPAPTTSLFGTTAQPASTQAAPGSIFGTSFTSTTAPTPTGRNPFTGGTTSAPSSFNFGSNDNPGATFSFTGTPGAPTISFGGATDSSAQPSQPNTSFGGSNLFQFGANTSQTNGSMFSQQAPSTTNMFGSTLAPGGGTSTGTNSPFTFGGASSLATTPAASTPEPAAEVEQSRGTNADGDEAPQEQISLTDGGPGEEDESVVHEVRAKAVKLVVGGDSEDDDSGSAKDKKSPWKTQGVGPLRILKNKKTGAVRMLLRAEPRGHIALNKLVLPNFSYKVDSAGGKYIKLTTATEDGKGLETWMLQVKTADAAKALAESLEANKSANAK
ncbi:nucleoporin nup61 [Echria macrotheca]|uniref:Nucleoporin nup61 n=1 Tax=Echria macrotheca TaxID=438768 RepID=A0AAJ0BC05_9PEZI|nr:nucleoporin nup61 [Echria macrotheca]